jgi:sialic acid synthase SpsE
MEALRAFVPTVGYSDHTLGTTACIAAAALGARILEKHFTIAHDHSDFRDHRLSATPEEFRAMVSAVREVEAMRGDGEKRARPCEEGTRELLSRSLAAKRRIDSGAALSAEDVAWIRPGGGIAPGEEGAWLGRRTSREIEAGSRILPDDLLP